MKQEWALQKCAESMKTQTTGTEPTKLASQPTSQSASQAPTIQPASQQPAAQRSPAQPSSMQLNRQPSPAQPRPP